MKITQASANMDEINDFDCFPLPLHTYNDVKSADHCLNNLEIFKAFVSLYTLPNSYFKNSGLY